MLDKHEVIKKEIKIFDLHRISKFIHLTNIYGAPTEFSCMKALKILRGKRESWERLIQEETEQEHR